MQAWLDHSLHLLMTRTRSAYAEGGRLMYATTTSYLASNVGFVRLSICLCAFFESNDKTQQSMPESNIRNKLTSLLPRFGLKPSGACEVLEIIIRPTCPGQPTSSNLPP
eukprot:4008353-Amphidinium_carterae.1